VFVSGGDLINSRKSTETGQLSIKMLIFCFRAWLKCKDMQDVEVKLPPGLAPSVSIHIPFNFATHSSNSEAKD
jgi:hypothetical protein